MLDVKNFLDGLIYILFPSRCVHCGRTLSSDEHFLCKSCEADLPLTHFTNFNDNLVTKIFYGRLPIIHGFSYLHFVKNSPAQSILHSIKYSGRKELATYMGQKMAYRMLEQNFPMDFDALLPVPLHPKKQRLRGFNQSEILAKAAADILGKTVINDAVIRSVFTQTQTKLTKEQRWENVQNIFKVIRPEKIQDKHIVMVDDVLTTGATLESLGQTLLQVKNVKLSFITLATAKNI